MEVLEWSQERLWVLRVKLYFVVQLKMVGACNIPRTFYANPHSNLHNFNIKTKMQRLHLLARTFVKKTTCQKWIRKVRKDLKLHSSFLFKPLWGTFVVKWRA